MLLVYLLKRQSGYLRVWQRSYRFFFVFFSVEAVSEDMSLIVLYLSRFGCRARCEVSRVVSRLLRSKQSRGEKSRSIEHVRAPSRVQGSSAHMQPGSCERHPVKERGHLFRWPCGACICSHIALNYHARFSAAFSGHIPLLSQNDSSYLPS